MTNALSERPADCLPRVESNSAISRLGQVYIDGQGIPRVNLGGPTDERLAPYDTATLRDGAIHVDMFTIDGRQDADYAVITANCQAGGRADYPFMYCKISALLAGGINPIWRYSSMRSCREMHF